MSFDVRRVTNGPKHHLFGFHDLVQTNARGDLALSLEVDDISRPPLPGETCRAGVVDLETGAFVRLHDTHTWNYPQGARQQWVGDTDLCVCNDRAADHSLVARVADARGRKVVETLPFPVHCLAGNRAFYIDYDRVHACGGYGYVPGAAQECPARLADIPAADGLFFGDLGSKEHGLLVPLAQVAACGEAKPVRTGYPHYLTHPALNPGGTRICFLHRYRVPDGGETTRLMTVGTDGSGLRCLAKGFLSHFTWISDDEIFIWGRDERALCRMREAAWLRVPGVLQLALLAKRGLRLARSLRPQGKGLARAAGASGGKAFLRLRDCDSPTMAESGVGVLTEDGHPMSNPRNRHLLVNDTYPNGDGDRWLMLYDVDSGERTDIGRFRRLFAEPDPATFDWRAAQTGIDRRVLGKFPRPLYLFARSGYHADLHPRWSYDGQTAYFDSIHEGTRQIYAVQG